jgi:PAS domain S-box-containing protein
VNEGHHPRGRADPARRIRPLAICEFDRELRCLRVNAATAAITRRPLADHLGRRLQEILPSAAGPLGSLCSQALASGEAIIDSDLLIAAPNDRCFVTILPRRDDEGRPIGVTVLFPSTTTPSDLLGRMLRYRLRFEALLSELARGFVGSRSDEIDAQISQGLERIVEFFAVDAGQLHELRDDGRFRLLRHALSPGVKFDVPELPDVEFPWLAAEVLRGRDIRISHLDALPPEAGRDRLSIASRGVRSLVICPIVIDRQIGGAIVLSSTRQERQWPGEIVGTLRLAGEMFGAAIARRRAEEQLAEEREFAEVVLDTLPGLFFALDEQGRLSRWNKSHELVLGYSVDELRGLPFEAYCAPEDIPGIRGAIDRIWREGAGSTEFHVVTRDGRHIPHLASSRVATIGGQRHIVGFGMDVSALKAAEDQIRRQQVEMAHVARVSAMGELATAIAHELNQPLTAIRTNAQATRRMLASGKLDKAELDEALADINADAGRAGEIIRRLRELLRKGDAEKLPLDVNEVVRSVEPLTKMDALHNDVSLVMDLAPDLPPTAGDRIQLQQVMLNLVRNGCDAMRDSARHGGRLTLHTALAQPGTIEITVEDTGPPLSHESFARMFRPFYTTKAGGLGVGLSISRSIVEAHGGLLWASRNPEQGLTLHLTLPCEVDGPR